jgi:hypothetical protein
VSGPLERRLAALEGAAGIGLDAVTIFVSFVPAADPPAATATVGGRVWHRAPGEVEARFLERVGTEARNIRPLDNPAPNSWAECSTCPRRLPSPPSPPGEVEARRIRPGGVVVAFLD